MGKSFLSRLVVSYEIRIQDMVSALIINDNAHMNTLRNLAGEIIVAVHLTSETLRFTTLLMYIH